MNDEMKIIKMKIRKMILEPQPSDDFKDGWCYALDQVLLFIEEIEKKK